MKNDGAGEFLSPAIIYIPDYGKSGSSKRTVPPDLKTGGTIFIYNADCFILAKRA